MGELVNAPGEITAHVPADAASTGRRSHQAELHAGLLRHCPRVLKAGLHGRRLPEQVGGHGDIAKSTVQPFLELLAAVVIDIEADAARPNHAPAEPAAAQQCCEIEEIATDSAAVGSGR